MSKVQIVKCKVCDKTAYPLESIMYDNMTWHKSCFRCLSCQSVVALKRVALIQGNLYCKTCFMRMFTEKGTYTVFTEKGDSRPASVSNADATKENGAAAVAAVAATESTSGDASAATTANDTAQQTAAKSVIPPFTRRKSAVLKKCEKDGCSNQRVGVTSFCEEHSKTDESKEFSDPNIAELVKFITQKSVVDVKKVLDEHGAELSVNTTNQTSPLELAFTSGSIACGRVMVEALVKRLEDLEKEVKKLEDEQEETQRETFVILDSARGAEDAPADSVDI